MGGPGSGRRPGGGKGTPKGKIGYAKDMRKARGPLGAGILASRLAIRGRTDYSSKKSKARMSARGGGTRAKASKSLGYYKGRK